MNSRRTKRAFASPVEQWPNLDDGGLDEADRRKYETRRDAIKDLYRGKTYRQVQKTYGISAKEINRHISRCQKLHADGHIWGFRCLVDRTFLEAPVRKSGANPDALSQGRGTKGLFAQLLNEHSLLQVAFSDLALRFKKALDAGCRLSIRDLHWEFITHCNAALKNDTTKYPLCLKYEAIDAFEAALWQRLDRGYDGDRGSSPIREGRSRDLPYSVVEIDTHKLDAKMMISVPLPGGGIKNKEIDRLCVLVARDRGSRSVLASKVVVSREISHTDVLECVYAICEPWVKREISIKGLQYPEGSGFPSGVFAHCAGRLPIRICLDNALAHLATNVRQALHRLGVTVNWGSAGEPNDRPYIESFFAWLTTGHIQPLPIGFDDTEASFKSAEINANVMSPSISEMEEYLDVLQASFNIKPLRSLYGETPFDVLRREKDSLLVRSDSSHSAPWRRLMTIKATFNIVVSKSGKPHVNFKDAIYRSNSLEHMVRLGLKSFEGEYNIGDIREIIPLQINGWTPEPLRVLGEWATFPHGLKLRQMIVAEMRHSGFKFRAGFDAMSCFRAHLMAKAPNSRRAATAVAKIDHEDGKSESAPLVAAPAVISADVSKMRSRPPMTTFLGELFPVDLLGEESGEI